MKLSGMILSASLMINVLTGCTASIAAEIGEPVPFTPSLAEQQAELEKRFSTAGYTFDDPEVIVDPYGNSPLTALVLFHSDESLPVSIVIQGKNEDTTYSHSFEAATDHMIPVYGLYPDTDNQVTVTCGGNTRVLSIQTEALPDDFILPESVYSTEKALDHSLYFYTPASSGYTCAYDTNGDVRWYLNQMALWDISRLDNGHLMLSTERLIASPYYSTGLYEMDMLGKIYSEYTLPGGYHHDCYEMENGNLLICTNDLGNASGTVEDVIAEVNRDTGEILRTIDLKDILNMESGKNASWTADDWFHNNAVWYDEETNSITLSGRHLDAVVNLDYSTLNINWILGSPDGWDQSYLKYFLTPVKDGFEWQWMQHAAMICTDGEIMLFDNGNNRSKREDAAVAAADNYSRLVRYRIDANAMTAEQTYEYGKERGSEFYSPYISDVDELGKDHYLTVSGGISYKDGEILNVPASLGSADTRRSDTVELVDGEVVFEMILPTNTYRIEKMQLYANDTYRTGAAKQLGSISDTHPDSTADGTVRDTASADETYEKAGIALMRQYDRLAFTGSFKTGDEVELIIEHDGVQDHYEVPVVKKYYKAMCVFIPGQSGTDVKVSRYIYSKTLTGHLYLRINEVTYDTGYLLG